MRGPAVTSRDPFNGVEVLLIDGNNLLHRLSGSVDPGAQRLLIARLRGVLPDKLRTIVMLDGHAASGTDRRQRVTRALELHHAGSMSADEALLNIIKDTAPNRRAGSVIVSDDRALTDKARHAGARTQRLAWLEQLLGSGAARPAAGSASIGAGKPPRAGSNQQSAGQQNEEREPWKPGRGATTKRGNPRRAPRAAPRDRGT